MKAIVKSEQGIDGIQLKDVPEPQPKAGELKVKIIAAGICGTDIHIMKDEYPYKPPVILGHEYVGTVVEVGSGVRGFKPGDNIVSLTAAVTCGRCKYCIEGSYMMCSSRLSIGSGVNGAMAEYMVIPARLAFKLPEDVVSIEQYAICEPLACVVRGVIERSTVKAGDVVLVSGPGTIGLLAVQLVKAQGGYVIVSGIPGDEKRLELARVLGADITVTNPEQLEEAIKKTTTYGVDVAFECAGVVASAEVCLKSLRKQGTYSQVGLFGKKITLDMDQFLFKELTITNNFAQEPSSWEIALRLLKNKQVDLNPLISAKLPIENWEQAFDKAVKNIGFKVLLVP